MCLRLFWIKKKNPHLHLEQLKNASLNQSSLFSSFSLSSLSHRPLKLLTVESLSTCMLHRVSCVVQEFCSDKRDKEKEALTASESVLEENMECSLMPLVAGHVDWPTQWDVNFPLLQQLSQLNCWAGKWQHWSGEKEKFLNLCLNPSVGVCIVIRKAYGGLR